MAKKTTSTTTSKKKLVKQIEELGPIMKNGKLIGFRTSLPFPNAVFRITQYDTLMCRDPNTCYVFDELGKAIANGTDKKIICYLNQFNQVQPANQENK